MEEITKQISDVINGRLRVDQCHIDAQTWFEVSANIFAYEIASKPKHEQKAAFDKIPKHWQDDVKTLARKIILDRMQNM